MLVNDHVSAAVAWNVFDFDMNYCDVVLLACVLAYHRNDSIASYKPESIYLENDTNVPVKRE